MSVEKEELDRTEFYRKFISERITQLRLNKGVSEREVSLSLGHSASYIQHITAGDSLPLLGNLIEICEYFNVSLEEFFASEMDSDIQNEFRARLSQLDKGHLEKLLRFFKSFSIADLHELIDIFDRRGQ